MRSVSDLRSSAVDSAFVRELNERLRTIEEAITVLEGQGGSGPGRKQALDMNNQAIQGISYLRFSTPGPLNILKGTEFAPDEGNTASVDDLAEVVIPEIYKALQLFQAAIRETQLLLSRRGIAEGR